MRALALSAALLITACGVEEPRDCVSDRCEAAGSKDELLGQLDGYSDPVANFLRGAVADDGTLSGDYTQVLDGVGAQLGCDAATEKHFVVLSNQAYAPKPIVTRCANDALGASQFFAAMVARPEGGIDPKQMHLASWDAEAGVYRRYQVTESSTGGMQVNVAPAFCMGCHGGPEKLSNWVPLMNEMSSPWSNWNSHPGFSSQLFDEHFPSSFAADPTYRALVDDKLESAAAFEPIVKAGVQRVTSARLKTRTQAADVKAARELVRPLFCDENTNYVSEVHDSGELRIAALVDDSIRQLYRSANVDGPWSWLADTRMQLPPPSGEAPVTLIAVRGEMTLQVELGLVARGVISPVDALRVRALDWKHPVGSAFRCGLYTAAAAKAIDTRDAVTVEDLIPVVFDEIMKSLSPTAGDVIAIPDATASTEGTELSLTQFGAELDAYVSGFQAAPMRAVLQTERNRRACAAGSDPTAPIFDQVTCP
jgi:hypothetical protein